MGSLTFNNPTPSKYIKNPGKRDYKFSKSGRRGQGIPTRDKNTLYTQK